MHAECPKSGPNYIALYSVCTQCLDKLSLFRIEYTLDCSGEDDHEREQERSCSAAKPSRYNDEEILDDSDGDRSNSPSPSKSRLASAPRSPPSTQLSGGVFRDETLRKVKLRGDVYIQM